MLLIKNIAILSSHPGSGKSTVAKILSEITGYKRDELGSPIHDISHLANPHSGRDTREHLQGIAESFRTIYGENIWIENFEKRNKDENGVIVTDVRKMSEYAHFVVEKGYIPIYIRVWPETARKRVLQRDGVVGEGNSELESQLRFIENLDHERASVQTGSISITVLSGIDQVCCSGSNHLNSVYILDGERSKQDIRKTLEKWWEGINYRN